MRYFLRTALFLPITFLAVQAGAKSNPASNAADGCYQIIGMEFEDGASMYRTIEKLVLEPLRRDPSTTKLAKFLESALVTTGHLTLNQSVCDSVAEALK